MAIFGKQLIALIPEPIVAAAVINALSHALNPKAKRNKILLLARVKDPLQHLLLELAPAQFQHKIFWSVADAVAGAQKITQLSIINIVNHKHH
jgi:hypothetical protein